MTVSPSDASKQGRRIAFVQSGWHKDIVDVSRRSFLAEIKRLGFDESEVDLYEVTGAFEIPLHAKRLAGSGRYSAVVGAGLVVDGGIYRHEFVASTVVDALMRLQLETGVPMISAVLTPHHFHEHIEHRKYFHAHFAVKGTEAADACIKTIESLRRVDALMAA